MNKTEPLPATMDSSSALPGRPRQGSGPLLSPSVSGVTPDDSDQGPPTTHKIPRSTLQGSETILIIDGILERLNIANSSIKQQVYSLQTIRTSFENEQELRSQDGAFQPFGYSNSEHQNPQHLDIDIQSFDIPITETLNSLFEEYEDMMNMLRRWLPANRSRPERPEPRDFSRHSRLLDGHIDIEVDSGQGSWFSRVFTNIGLRRLWGRYVGRRDDPRTHDPPFTITSRRVLALMGLPVEVLALIIDQSILDDRDRLRFGATCARAMSVSLPVMYKYAMVRYPIKKRPLNETLKLVGHMVRELIIYMPPEVEPVRNEDEYIDPFEIFDKMTGLTALTVYFDSPISPVEVSALMKYFLRTKDRLSHVTLDIAELRHPLAAYESRTVYQASRAAEVLRANGTYKTGAKLDGISFCIQQSPPDTSAAAVREVFTGYCDPAMYLRILPYIRNRETLNLTPFRSRKADLLQYVVRDGMNVSIYEPALQAVADLTSLRHLRVFAYTKAQFILDNMRGSSDSDHRLPFTNLRTLHFDCVQPVPPDESFFHNADLQNQFFQRASRIIQGVPKLVVLSCIERVDGFNFELRVLQGPGGAGNWVTTQTRAWL
ncbi:hypothetical protein AOL_s00215g714 [Orbilia oligospora ATCC 24927]|uniref:Uncharacterized protein n=1 Tax=Arthrobotrys oligospora (strain ATCC 24927 / CBS 115.81 / DSM 1491) TaxID=756982 RepID=G1XUQ6_ARTOA|nr:hypothetical protein AOL_s00215g714 [Orbilia oligospora ATCC 24927]EGX43105.1 hypothetical protein AOL_s00215g714 [Orbilia oligospora ATCC 24927]